MRRYLRPSAVNGPVSAWGLYKSDDDQTHSDDLCCRGGGRGGNLARPAWRRAIRSPPVRSIRPRRRPIRPAAIPSIIAARPGAPDFDALDDDDDAPNAQSSTALPPPGPVLSPDDPRYGRPDSRPVYSDRAPGPDPVAHDPRYGRPDGPPPVIYSDRPAGPPQQTYSDRGDDDRVRCVRREASARPGP